MKCGVDFVSRILEGRVRYLATIDDPAQADTYDQNEHHGIFHRRRSIFVFYEFDDLVHGDYFLLSLTESTGHGVGKNGIGACH